MHVKEDLIFNKHSGELIGFSNLGDINNNLEVYLRSLDTDIEQSPSLAKSVMHGIYGCEGYLRRCSLRTHSSRVALWRATNCMHHSGMLFPGLKTVD